MSQKKKILSKMSLRLRSILSCIFIIVLPLCILVFACLFPIFIPKYVYLLMLVSGALGWWLLQDVMVDITRIVNKAKEKWSSVLKSSSKSVSDVDFLREAFDQISSKVRSGVEELSEISKTSEKLNQDVGANVTLLSAVIKLNEMMLMESSDEVLHNYIIHKLREILSMDVGLLLLDDRTNNRFEVSVLDSVRQLEFSGIDKDEVFLHSLIADKQMIVVDSANSYRSDFQEFFKTNLGLENILLMPIVINDEVLGMVGCGAFVSRQVFSGKDIEILNFFIKYIVFNLRLNMSAVVVNDADIKDALTGLYTEHFMIDRLDEEIIRNKNSHKPCGIFTIKLKRFKDYLKDKGTLMVESDLKKVARVLLEDLPEGGKAVRCSEDRFSVVMPACHKARLDTMAHEAMRRLSESFGEKFIEMGMVYSVAEMPIDGITSNELLAHAKNETKELA